MKDKQKTKNPISAFVISLAMGLYFIYKGIDDVCMGYGMTTFGILLIICGVVLVIGAIFMLCKKTKKEK